MNDDYLDVLPKQLVMPFSEEWLESLWQRQCDTPRDRRQKVCVVCDDVLSDPAAIYSVMLNTLYSQGRHASVDIIVCSQSDKWVLSPLRKVNSDLILLSKVNEQVLQDLFRSTQGIDKKQWLAVCTANAGIDFKFLAYDNASVSNRLEDVLLAVRAKPPRGRGGT